MDSPESGYQEMDSGNKGSFNGNIKFVLGSGKDKKGIKAAVFFQMTKKGLDLEEENKELIEVKNGYKIKKINKTRRFFGHTDLVLLKLDNYQDDNYKKTYVIDPESLFSGVDEEVGLKISCHGSPVHMTEKKYGSCDGKELKWKQENARIFSDSSYKSGVVSNVAATFGMSGGPCYLNNNPDQVFGIVANGYITDSEGNIVMPNLNFDNGNFSAGDARHIGLLHVLDQRLKAELGFGLDQISENCK
jgi:hypothetical protein